MGAVVLTIYSYIGPTLTYKRKDIQSIIGCINII